MYALLTLWYLRSVEVIKHQQKLDSEILFKKKLTIKK